MFDSQGRLGTTALGGKCSICTKHAGTKPGCSGLCLGEVDSTYQALGAYQSLSHLPANSLTIYNIQTLIFIPR